MLSLWWYFFTELLNLALNVQVVIHLKLSAPQILVQFKNKLPDRLSGPYNIHYQSIFSSNDIND